MSEFKNSPGAALESLIPEWAVEQDKSNCGCNNMKKAMNNWGTERCKKKREYLVRHLMSQNEMLIPALKKLPAPIKKLAAGAMVDKAIRMAS